MTSSHSAYDELSYESLPIPGTSPARLRRASALHAGPCPPERDFRAVELGCGDGSNLLPLAFYHPQAAFTGIDAAATAIGKARAGAHELGLRNVRLEHTDLADPQATPAGMFDYAIVHGVFSWVDARTRDGVLRLVRECLAPRGLLYLSYNVRAGWIVRDLVRDLLRNASGDQGDPHGRVRRARQVARELSPVVAGSDHAYHQLLIYELERVAAASEGYLYHEYLAPENVAFDHTQVVTLLTEQGLAYLCDAWHDSPEGCIPEELRHALERLGQSGGALEQAADILGYRRFRASVFCRHAACAVGGGAAGTEADDDAPAVHEARGRPHRLAIFEAARRASLTTPEHSQFTLSAEERGLVGQLGTRTEVDAPADFVERLGQAGLLES